MVIAYPFEHSFPKPAYWPSKGNRLVNRHIDLILMLVDLSMLLVNKPDRSPQQALRIAPAVVHPPTPILTTRARYVAFDMQIRPAVLLSPCRHFEISAS